MSGEDCPSTLLSRGAEGENKKEGALSSYMGGKGVYFITKRVRKGDAEEGWENEVETQT